MATTSTIKRGDTKLTFTDRPTIDGVQLLLSALVGCTVSFLLKSDAKSIKQGALIIADPLDITKAYFTYDSVTTDVDTSGKYKQEWELVFPGGKVLTFPNNGYNVVKIIDDLG